jgi:putative nucleotidyltransferase with HDIG domain
MCLAVENLRLRGLYQGFSPPATAATEAADARRPSKRVFQWSISNSSRGGRRRRDLIPLLGDIQEDLSSFAVMSKRRASALDLFAATLATTALTFAAGLVAVGGWPTTPLWGIVVLALLAAIAERQPVQILINSAATVSVLPMLFAAVVYGPLAAMLVGAIGLIGDFRRPYVRWVIWTSMRALAGGLAGSAAFLILSDGRTLGHLVLAVTVAVVTDAIIDAGLSALTVTFRGSGSCADFLRSVQPILLASVSFYVPVLVLLVYAYEELSAWSLILFFLPAVAAHSLHRLYREQREAAESLTEANKRLEKASLSFAAALVAALDARDQYTAGHSASVAIYARDIAARLGLSEERQQLAHLCGLVHDIGKVGLPAGLLEKPGALTLDERRRMEEHSEIGERILANVDNYTEIAKIVRHHHERVDGNGYPDGLARDEVPLISRIIAVADAYDAMTSDRPYRDAMASQVARLRLAQAVGTQFDTTVVAAFEAILATASETYRSGARADFSIEAQRQPALVPVLSATPAA